MESWGGSLCSVSQRINSIWIVGFYFDLVLVGSSAAQMGAGAFCRRRGRALFSGEQRCRNRSQAAETCCWQQPSGEGGREEGGEEGGRRKEEGGRRKGEGGRRKEEGGRGREEGGRRKEEGGRRKEEGGRRKEEGLLVLAGAREEGNRERCGLDLYRMSNAG